MSDASHPERRAIFQNHQLFGQLTVDELDRLLLHARIERCARDQVIFHKGDPGAGLMAVIRGQVRISAPAADGREIVLNIIEPGQIFGEIALLDGRDRTADAVAWTDCELLALERRDFLPFLERHPDVSLRLLRVLCDRLRRTSAQVEDLLFLDLPARLAKKLLALAQSHGARGPAGLRIDLKLSQRELGNLVGMSRESINKQLRAWQGEGLIDMQQGTIVLKQAEALKDLAEAC